MTATVTTAQAAETAGVTVDTIRYWARYGAVRATKVARRWVIDAASLARRIALGIRRTRKAKKIEFTTENTIAIGGNRWQRYDKDRVYINDWTQFIGLEVSHYKTGNISSASLEGYSISNSQARQILGAISKVYFDAADGKIHIIHYGYSGREFDDVAELCDKIRAGIRSAIAAL